MCIGDKRMTEGIVKEKGTKADTGKPRYDLMPVYPTEQEVLVYTFGAKKYEPDNWRKGIEVSRGIAAIQRHLASFKAGEDNDAETKLPHLASIVCTAKFIMETLITHPEMDDRPKGVVGRDGKIIQTKS